MANINLIYMIVYFFLRIYGDDGELLIIINITIIIRTIKKKNGKALN